MASQYRGNDGGEGLEEFGGADVGDVVTLVSLASSLPYADPKNIFFYGVTRGGMMTFLALARGVAVNAAAVVGGIYDMQGLMESAKQRMPGVANRVMKSPRRSSCDASLRYTTKSHRFDLRSGVGVFSRSKSTTWSWWTRFSPVRTQ